MCRRAGSVLAVFLLSFAAVTQAAEDRSSDSPVASNRVIDLKGEQTTLKIGQLSVAGGTK